MAESSSIELASSLIIINCYMCSDYLHQWSKELDIPVLSIDYTLAPEASYPRAIQEVFYSYCWTLEHAKLLGWNGNRIIVSGDSAGGNMGASLVLQCIQNGIRY